MNDNEFNAISMELSQKVRIIAKEMLAKHGYSGIRVSEDAPGSYEEMIREYQEKKDTFTVYAGASDKTIYDSALTNWYMRAWHDLVHVELGARFDVIGDSWVGAVQASNPMFTETERQIIWFDVVGQAVYESQIGKFPGDQRAFVIACMEAGLIVFDDF